MPMISPRVSMVKVGPKLLPLLLLLLSLVTEGPGQNLPHPFNTPIPAEELPNFQNSHLLVKEEHQDLYLYKGISRNFTFTISQDSPILIVVTPCASEIHGILTVLTKSHSDLTWIGEQHKSLSRSRQLAQFTGQQRQTLPLSAVVGTYILTVTSLQSDSHVKILVSLQPDITDSRFPSVPTNSQVRVVLDKRSLVIDWPPTTRVNKLHSSAEYCVAVSRIKNFQTHCAALAYFHGDKKPVFVEWGFADEKEKFQELRRMAKPIKKAPKKMMFFKCVGNNTTYTFNRAASGKNYFVDVFVVDKDKDFASSYVGATVKMKYHQRSPKTTMRVGETRTINLKRKTVVEVTVNSTLSRLAFEVVPCSGKIPVQLYYNGTKRQAKTVVRRWKRLFVRPAQPGTYLMTFPRIKKKRTYVSVFVTARPSRSRVEVPQKRKLRIFSKLTTCSRATLAWMGASVQQNYCVYSKKLRKDGRDSRRRRCLSPAERSATDRQTCLTHAASDSGSRSAIAYNVTGLQPDSWYRFDVFVQRGRSAQVPYKSVKVKTLEHCQI